MPYVGYSMSVNAAIAYDCGEAPLSRWTREGILTSIDEDKARICAVLTLAELREHLLYKSSWHHTSCRYNRTDFYSIDWDAVAEMDEAKVAEIISRRKPRERKEKTAPQTVHATIRYTIWRTKYSRYGRKTYVPEEVTEEVVYTKGDKMVQTKNGMKRMSSVDILTEEETK